MHFGVGGKVGPGGGIQGEAVPGVRARGRGARLVNDCDDGLEEGDTRSSSLSGEVRNTVNPGEEDKATRGAGANGAGSSSPTSSRDQDVWPVQLPQMPV